MAGYVNRHANRVYNVSLLALPFLNFPVTLSIVGANNHRISIPSGLGWLKFRHSCMITPLLKQSSIATLLRVHCGH